MGRDTKEYAGDINGYTETVPTDPHSSIFRNIENSNQDQQEKEAMLDRQEKRVQDAMSMAKTLLTAREYEVISEIFVKGVKAVSLAKSWGCSKANISKLQKKAVDKLKTVAGG
jgi:DNA-directed RNA polymerase specialized sigma subunit